MSQPLTAAAVLAALALVSCQTSDPARDGFVPECRARGHAAGSAALADCVKKLSDEKGEPFGAKTGSCVAFCNR